MSQFPSRTPVTGKGGECEAIKLLGLEGEYISFLLGVESEIRLLNHVLGCDECRRSIVKHISGEKPFELGPLDGLFSPMDGMPLNEIRELIEQRAKQRIEQLEGLRGDAELELNDLRRNLKDLVSSSSR